MTLEKLIESTESIVKLQKIYNSIQKKINENPEYYKRLEELDLNDDKLVCEYIEEVLGEPKGLWKNTKEEQIKLLRRIKNDLHDTKGIDFVRPDYSGDNGTF